MMLGHHLEPGGRFAGDYLVLSLDNLLDEARPRATIHRVKEVVRPPGPITFPLREARIMEKSEKISVLFKASVIDDLEEEIEVEASSLEENVDAEPPLEIQDVPYVSDALQRVPRGSRIYIPRVGPRPARPPPALDPDMGINFVHDNPKRPGSRSHELFEAYKTSKTVGEAMQKGATKGHLRYDLTKGYAKLAQSAAVVCVGPLPPREEELDEDAEMAVAAPLLEGWCDPNSALGEAGPEHGRIVYRFTEHDDLSNPSTVAEAFRTARQNPCMAPFLVHRGANGSASTGRGPVWSSENEFDEHVNRAWNGSRRSRRWAEPQSLPRAVTRSPCTGCAKHQRSCGRADMRPSVARWQRTPTSSSARAMASFMRQPPERD